MTHGVLSLHSAKEQTADALAELTPDLQGFAAVAVLFFCSSNHDGIALQRELRELFPTAEIAGCTTGGEFTHTGYSQGGVSVVALAGDKVKRCAAALAEYGGSESTGAAVRAATQRMEATLGVQLREVNPKSWVGVVLNEGLKGNEEEVNEVLGHVAPLLSFLGGSAGDNFQLKETKVFYGGRESNNGSVLFLMELSVPYAILKTCSFRPTEQVVTITRAEGRLVREIDGAPAAARYAEVLGLPPGALGPMVFAGNPLGVVIDGDPWVRSPLAPTPDGGLIFGCKVLEGSELSVLASTDLVANTERALKEAVEQLGCEPSVGVLFNCAHRCMEIQGKQLEPAFRKAISGFPVVGFHSYGESWLAHMNQTLIGLLIG